MSAYIRTLEKQNEMLRDEVRIHAQAVDTLSERLAGAMNELQALKPQVEHVVMDGPVIDGGEPVGDDHAGLGRRSTTDIRKKRQSG